MREVFKPTSESGDPGRVFYTITRDDIGHGFIQTTAGQVALGSVMGFVLAQDVGKRLYRLPNHAGDSYIWQVESNDQRDQRLGKEREI